MKGERRRVLNRQEIFKQISEYDVYRLYLPDFKNLGDLFRNTIRGEKDPSMKVNFYMDRLTHFDFGDSRYRGDCVNLVEQIFNCDYNTALLQIDKDFNLGISHSRIESLKPVIMWQPLKEIPVKYPPNIKVITRKPFKEELDYWYKLDQGLNDLKEENIFFPKMIFRNGSKLPQVKDLLTFCYFYPEIEKWALYRPFAPKKQADTPPQYWKWDKSLSFNHVDRLDTISGPGNNFLTKGRKDRMVLKKALETNKIAIVQSEDPMAMSEEALNIIKLNSEEFGGINYAATDNDKKGKEFSWWLTKEHGYKHMNVPDKYLYEVPKKTDFPDLVWYYNMNLVKNYFKEKNITK